MLEQILATQGLTVTARHRIEARQARFSPHPPSIHPAVGAALAAKYPSGLYSHQAEALSESLSGNDVCLSTSTASGKSLVFISAAADLLRSNPNARVLALYPAKALIQDQLNKWRDFIIPLGPSVGFVDGSIPTEQRSHLLRQHRVILMTPDVLHAWFMNSLAERAVSTFRSNLGLLILDEAHVYDGVFGTNMAFLLRRLQAVSSPCRLICSTATLGSPNDFVFQLTGRTPVEFTNRSEGSKVPEKLILATQLDEKRSFEISANLLRVLAATYSGRFIAFADSRKSVELMTAAAHRSERIGNPSDVELQELASETAGKLLPYRAGYENEDRSQIQAALSNGSLRGVVSTSALELGIDIGEVDLVVLLCTPPSMKAFWQRVGRAGRRNSATCLLLDTTGIAAASNNHLTNYLNQPIEPNWLYLPNRYIQYTNALCAALELQDAGGSYDQSHFSSLPLEFRRFLEQEVNPSEMLPADLLYLKQRSQGSGPHREFPLRSGIEKTYQVESQNTPLGSLTFPQVLREGYPGAIYYYMARPYRVQVVQHTTAKITASPTNYYTTKPISQIMVFPDLSSGLLRLLTHADSFVAEANLQVSERVTGFREKRGPNETTYLYQAGSPFAQRPLNRFITTTGVCWFFPDGALMTETIAEQILSAFCQAFAVQPRELGLGRFHVQQSPTGSGPLNGLCIFDATHGSLRLTERLGEHFSEIVNHSLRAALASGQANFTALQQLAQSVAALQLRPVIAGQTVTPQEAQSQQWITIIAPEQPALLVSGTEATDVVVDRFLITLSGAKYRLRHSDPGIAWMVSASDVRPLDGITRLLQYRPDTGEERPFTS
jgi:DEAD/DEAH box helicase domain-containing protein